MSKRGRGVDARHEGGGGCNGNGGVKGGEGEGGRGNLVDSLSPPVVSVRIVVDTYVTDQSLYALTNICVSACVVTL